MRPTQCFRNTETMNPRKPLLHYSLFRLSSAHENKTIAYRPRFSGTGHSAGQAKEKANPKTANATMSVGQSLAGHVIQMVDGEAQDAKIKSDAEYYVLYHSASW